MLARVTKSEREHAERGAGIRRASCAVVLQCAALLLASLTLSACIVDVESERRSDPITSSRRQLLERHIGRANDEVRQLHADKARIERDLKRLKAEVIKLEAERSEAARRNAELQRSLAASLEKQTFLERSLAESKKRIDDVSKQLEAARRGVSK